MARNVSGFSSIYAASRWICRMVGRFGVARFTAQTTPEFGAAVEALVLACHAFEALDDFPGEADHTPGGSGGDDTEV